MDADDLERWRSEFPILDRSVYLISNSLGAMPRGAADALAAYADAWATRGVRAWEERWWEMAGEIGQRIAVIIGARPGAVSMHENVTTAAMIALSTISPRPGKNRIICLAADFPSTIYLYRAHETAGFDVGLVPAESDFTVRTDRVIDSIDERTALVSLSHVLFKSSFIMDVAPIIVRAHEVGALVLLDGYQSAGIIPVDVAALDVDFFVGGCLKWLCGGPGTAFLYTHPDVAPSLSPRFTGWFSHRSPFAFDIGEPTVRDDGMRMMNGTPSIPAYYAALPGLEIISTVGVDRIREKSKRLTTRILELADHYEFPSIATRDPARLAGTVAVNPPEALHVSRSLKARDFVVDYRPGVGIRISPHFYNTLAEIERLMADMAHIVEHKAYDVDTPSRSVVT